jgi:hypothetical protein
VSGTLRLRLNLALQGIGGTGILASKRMESGSLPKLALAAVPILRHLMQLRAQCSEGFLRNGNVIL